MVNLTIDGVAVEAEEGSTILAAAAKAGIEIPNLCFMKDLAPYGACGVCVVEVEKCPKLLRACSAKVAEGMVVNTRSERALRARKLALELMMGDHDGDCRGPCSLNCPAGTDCQKYVKEIAEGRFEDACRTVMDVFPLPGSIGRVCPHPCEDHCRRRLVEEPISIAALKAFAADWSYRKDAEVLAPAGAPTGRRVAIVGGGPAGLTAAYQLLRKGHAVTVYEQMPEMGGMLRYGIPEYRLPKLVLTAESRALERMGAKFVNNWKLGRDGTLERLRAEQDAVIVANGAWKSVAMRVPGEDLDGVWGGIDFLRERPDVRGRRVVVVGGGNTAMDACRTAVRLGAEEVSVVYRRTRREMPAEELEVADAEEEGVVYRFLRNPAEILGENGRVKSVKLQVMELGEPDERGRRRPVAVEGSFEELEVDVVIAAIGQKNDPAGFEALPVTDRGTIAADPGNFATALDGVFACGDAVNRGAGIAIQAIAQANEAAKAVDAYLKGGVYRPEPLTVSRRDEARLDFSDRERLGRVARPLRAAEDRRGDFHEAVWPLKPADAIAEAKRCLECGCHDYSECRLIRYAKLLKTDCGRLRGDYHPGFTERRLEVIERDQRKCIGCNLCVRVCEEQAKKGILGLVGRGFTTVIRPEFDDPAVIAGCADCRRCAEACPTGALKLVAESPS